VNSFVAYALAIAYALAMRIDATAFRRDLYETIKTLDGPVEITRNERIVAVLSRPTKTDASSALIYDPRRLARICKRCHVRWLFLFGSAARAELGPDSDVDVIAEAPLKRKTFHNYATLASALEDLFGRRVDLSYYDTFERYAGPSVKAAVLRDLKAIYGEA
jgi:predicted nucleotidyltransferase